MTLGRYLLLFNAIGMVLCSCNGARDIENDDAQVLTQLEQDVKESLAEHSKEDSLSRDIVLDTFFLKGVDKKDYQVAFAQYHTSDNKLDLSILGIHNFEGLGMPTYLLVDTREKMYLIDSIKTHSDSLYIYCQAVFPENLREPIEISFDLKFNGHSFPWNVK